MIATFIMLLGIVQGVPTAWPAPAHVPHVVVATTQRGSSADVKFMSCKTDAEVEKLAKETHYVVVPFEDSLVVYSENIFNLYQARQQIALFQDLAPKIEGKRQVLKASDLDAKAEKRLRDIVGEDPQNAQRQYAAKMPDLKFQIVPTLVMSFQQGDKSVENVRVDPYMDAKTSDRIAKDAPLNVTKDVSAASPLPKPKAIDEMSLRIPTPYLSFLFSDPDLKATRKLRITKEIAERLGQECAEVEKSYEQAFQKLADALTAAYPETFGKLPRDRMPKLVDLDHDAQKQALQNLGNWSSAYGFGSASEAQAYFTNADTTDARVDLTLRLDFPLDSGPTWSSYDETVISLRNPLGH